MNTYERAAQVRERGLLGNITDNLVSGEGSIAGGIGRGISDTFKAKVTGVKEKFDPLNIAKKMTGGVGAGIVGRMMGRSKEDIGYFANKGKGGGLLGKAFGAMKPKDKLGGVDTAFYSNISDGSRDGLKKNDSLANVGAKLYNVMKTSYDIKTLERELDKNFSKERAAEDRRRHEEFIDTEFLQPNRKRLARVVKDPDDIGIVNDDVLSGQTLTHPLPQHLFVDFFNTLQTSKFLPSGCDLGVASSGGTRLLRVFEAFLV
jgi:hypothetical protein